MRCPRRARCSLSYLIALNEKHASPVWTPMPREPVAGPVRAVALVSFDKPVPRFLQLAHFVQGSTKTDALARLNQDIGATVGKLNGLHRVRECDLEVPDG